MPIGLVRSATVFALLVTSALVLGACRRTQPIAEKSKEDELVVFAAASLRESFSTLGSTFEQSHPNVEVRFNFAGSQELRTQIEHGAPADVFASADQRHMGALVAEKKAERPVLFARNEPVMIVAKEQAKNLVALADLPNATRIVLGVPEVPIGRYTQEILERASQRFGNAFSARVESRVVSRELNVRQVLAKIALGEADAAIVYRTDAVAAADRVTIVTLPPELNVIAEYPIAVLDAAPHPELARAWVDHVRSERGRNALAKAGFMLPVPPLVDP
jgi:molybdate transport system substrate-binding protein